jgi:hypothetical protein
VEGSYGGIVSKSRRDYKKISAQRDGDAQKYRAQPWAQAESKAAIPIGFTMQ